VIIGSNEDKYFHIGTQLPLVEKEELLRFLRKNIDVCAWNVLFSWYATPLISAMTVMLYLALKACSSWAY